MCVSVRSVTIVLKNMDGVAFTKGNELDDDHKEIHISTTYIEKCQNRAREEMLGVLVHEMVHCFQYNGKGTCPGGLIEGIAGGFISLSRSRACVNLKPARLCAIESGSGTSALAEGRRPLGPRL